MADISDVIAVLVGQATAAVYPNGTAQPSVANCTIRVYAGWPKQADLDADLLAGNVNISVYPGNKETNTTRYNNRWQQQVSNVATLTLVVEGATITVGGALPSPFFAQNLSILIGTTAYLHPLQSGDTLSSIATSLALQIPGASSNGAVITVPPGPTPIVRVGASGVAIQEIRRQQRLLRVVVWAPTAALRDSVTSAVDLLLAGQEFLTMPDGISGRLIYQDSPFLPYGAGGRFWYQEPPVTTSDISTRPPLFRRDLRYNVEFATTKTMTTTNVVAGVVTQQSTPTGSNTSVNTY
jgi:hypothetical protein